jgi:hypothetical protein
MKNFKNTQEGKAVHIYLINLTKKIGKTSFWELMFT